MIYRYVSHYVSTATIMSQVRHGITIAVSTLTSIGAITVSFVMSLILSFFYTLELKQMNEFSPIAIVIAAPRIIPFLIAF